MYRAMLYELTCLHAVEEHKRMQSCVSVDGLRLHGKSCGEHMSSAFMEWLMHLLLCNPHHERTDNQISMEHGNSAEALSSSFYAWFQG
jgi:hypothetical protein